VVEVSDEGMRKKVTSSGPCTDRTPENAKSAAGVSDTLQKKPRAAA